jgi:acetylornithine deacetylase/succinyl-diaminopimelate desuccinylase-like protein
VAAEPSENQIVLGARGIAQLAVMIDGRPAHRGRPREAANPIYPLAEIVLALERAELPGHAVLEPATIAPFELRTEAVAPQSPSRAELILDRRLLPEESVEDVRAALQRQVDDVLTRRPGFTGQVRSGRTMFPYRVSDQAPTVRLMQEAAHLAFGHPLPTRYVSFSSNTGYAVREMGIDGIAFGPPGRGSRPNLHRYRRAG